MRRSLSFAVPRYSLIVLATCLATLTTACDDFPRDPEGTLERVRGGELRVGIVEREPWARMTDGEPQGIEVEVVKDLAESLGATLEWSTSTGSQALEALEQRRIDLVIGGLDQKNPWEKYVAFTRPYLRFGVVASSKEEFDEIDGHHVLVEPGSPVGAYVEQYGGIPVSAGKVAEPPSIEAKPFWAVQPDEKVVTGLHEVRHVVAVPKGENAWLIHVDRFFQDRRAEVWDALDQTGQ